MKVPLIAGMLIVLIFAPAWAQMEKTGDAPDSIWVDGVGSGFNKNTFQSGGVVGAGVGQRSWGPRWNTILPWPR